MAKVTDTSGNELASFIYDAGGNRLIRKDPTGTTLYLPGQELKVTPAGAVNAIRYYTHGGGAVDSPYQGKPDKTSVGLYQSSLRHAARNGGGSSFTGPRTPAVHQLDLQEDLIIERWNFYRRIRNEMGDKELQYGLPSSAEVCRDFELIGDADTVIGTLEGFVKSLLLTDIAHSGLASGTPPDEAHADLKRFADRVLPTLKSW